MTNEVVANRKAALGWVGAALLPAQTKGKKKKKPFVEQQSRTSCLLQMFHWDGNQREEQADICP